MKNLLIVFTNIMFLLTAPRAFAYKLGAQSTHQPGVEKMALQSSAKANTRTYTCKYRSKDVGTIVGIGPSQHAAQADAAEKCFDHLVTFYEKTRGKTMNRERGQILIDFCVNITCS